jgi:NAD(P)H-dependent FMN reductase
MAEDVKLPKLHVVTVSTRPGRIGPGIARWFAGFARKHGKFDVSEVDLAEIGLPLLDEPNHPMRRQYINVHTKRWSQTVDAADAIVFVVPEYNYSPPPSLTNALDYLFWEWNYKPAGFVGYGGISGGQRSTGPARITTSSLKMMPVPEMVVLPNVFQQLKDGVFTANAFNEQGATAMLNEMAKWEEALRPLRAEIRRRQVTELAA